MTNKIDEKYMKIALDLARKGEGFTSPNPMVGAVIVKNNRIVGKGYHKRCGSAHAEANALTDAGRRAEGGTIYVSLEPCGHFGRTPPCADAIVRSGIRRAVIPMRDPNPINNGRGVRRLTRHGVKVIEGVLKEEARELNRPYIKFITKNMPYVTLKMAQSLDGKIATRTGESRWISAEDSRRYVRELRSKSDAVMIGANTVLMDDPLLLGRRSAERQPLRIIVCGRRRIPTDSKILSASRRFPVLLARPKMGRVDLKRVLSALAKKGIANILVEGGGELAASLIESDLVDRFLFFIAPKIIGGRSAKTPVEGMGIDRISRAKRLKFVEIKIFKEDILIAAEAARRGQA